MKDLRERTASGKVLREKPFDNAKNPKHDGYQRTFALIDCQFFYKKSVVGAVKDKIVLNEQSAEH